MRGGEDGGAPEEAFACAVEVGGGFGGVGKVGTEDLCGEKISWVTSL